MRRFDVPFQYGGTWTDAADSGPEPVMVISRKMNDMLFGGANSVGKRIRWNDHEFRVLGVRDNWLPLPTFYDVNNGSLEEPEDVYIPFGWNVALELQSAGNTNGWKPEDIKTYQDFLNSEDIWVQMWVELPDVAVPRPLPGLPRQLRAASRSRPAATRARSTTASRGRTSGSWTTMSSATTTACWSASPLPSSPCAC